MTDYFTYGKKRKEFGKFPTFADTETKVVGFVPLGGPSSFNDNYVMRNPNFIVLDNLVEMSEHSVNTEKVSTADKGMGHTEGGIKIC